jgi:SynChlorMet cassette radical SAM/SPASM protein ScmF
MEELYKNNDYKMHYVDHESGFSLLYSEKDHDTLFLNPLATVLWTKSENSLKPARYAKLFAEIMKIPRAEDYCENVVLDMHQKGLLISGSGTDKVSNNSELNNYPLRQIYFYVTRSCNARCYHCYQPTMTASDNIRDEKKISKDSFMALVENAIPLGLQSVKLTGGEPFLRDDLGDIIKAIAGKGLSVSVETNGYYIDEAMADLLVKNDVDVSISLDSGSEVIHDRLRSLHGSYKRVLNAIRLLKEREANPKVIMAISKKNIDQAEDVIKVASEYGCEFIKFNPVNTLGIAKKLDNEKILLSVDEIMELYKNRREWERKYDVFLFLEGPPSFSSIYEIVSGHSAVCPFTDILGILADGSISFCGVGNSNPELVFGNITEYGFDIGQFWRKAKPLVEVRNILNQTLDGVCKKCLLSSFCRGSCRALAYCKFNSFKAPHPWCKEAYDQKLFPAYYLPSMVAD